MTEIEKLKAELEPFKGTLVIYGFVISRLVDVVFDDDEQDFFWTLDSQDGIYFSSILMGWIPLKGILPENKYTRLVELWNMNNDNKVI